MSSGAESGTADDALRRASGSRSDSVRDGGNAIRADAPQEERESVYEDRSLTCGSCGGQAMVPFAPRNDRPVYCSSCFDKVRAGTITEHVTV